MCEIERINRNTWLFPRSKTVIPVILLKSKFFSLNKNYAIQLKNNTGVKYSHDFLLL